ncbi:MAG: hypothetical protein LBT11_06685 [Treponema sp.]|jgi:hypothetical protein|nr:hypothetical protein [Treponema sp.]
MKKNKRFIGLTALIAALFSMALLVTGCPTEAEPSAEEKAATALAADLGGGAAANSTTVTLGAGTESTTTLTKAVSVPAGVTLVVPAGKTFATSSYVLTVAATAIVKVDGIVTYGTSPQTNVSRESGSKFIFSSTTGAGSGGVHPANDWFNGSNDSGAWTIVGDALFTEIAGTSNPRAGWKHEISGGTVKLNNGDNIAAYGTADGDCTHLTVVAGATLNLNSTAATSGRGLKIGNGGVLTVAALNQLTGTGWLALNTTTGTEAVTAAATTSGTGKFVVGTTEYVNEYRGLASSFVPVAN